MQWASWSRTSLLKPCRMQASHLRSCIAVVGEPKVLNLQER